MYVDIIIFYIPATNDFGYKTLKKIIHFQRMKFAICVINLIYVMAMPYVAGNRVVCFFNSLANTTAFRTSIGMLKN